MPNISNSPVKPGSITFDISFSKRPDPDVIASGTWTPEDPPILDGNVPATVLSRLAEVAIDDHTRNGRSEIADANGDVYVAVYRLRTNA